VDAHLFDNGKNPRLVVVIPIRSDPQIDLGVRIFFIRSRQLEDAAARQKKRTLAPTTCDRVRTCLGVPAGHSAINMLLLARTLCWNRGSLDWGTEWVWDEREEQLGNVDVESEGSPCGHKKWFLYCFRLFVN
jgi:hypothetical protein